jgi:tetratricopeptide (TPR) repeat protein
MNSLTPLGWWLTTLVGMAAVIGLGVRLWRTKFVKLLRAGKLENQGTQLIADGYYENAEIVLTKSLRLAEKAVGSDDANIGPILANLAQAYQFQEKFAEAERLFKRAIPILENDKNSAGNEGHPFLVLVLGNFADMYREQNRDAEAAALCQQALSIRERALGPDHPDVATDLNNLAVLYQAQGRYAQAEPLYQRSFEIREMALGPEHPDVAQSLNNLAELEHIRIDVDRIRHA